MTWLRTDDGYYDHPKIRALDLDAYVLHHGGQILSARLETDGVVTEDQLYALSRKGLTNPKRVVKKLEAAGLWIAVDGGWRIHDFLEYNPSRAQKKHERAEGARRQRESRERRKQESQPKSRRDTGGDVTPSVTATRPDPTRPDPPVSDVPSSETLVAAGLVLDEELESDAWAVEADQP
ncbi:MAG: hypothetical protein AAF567_24350 [Actinomycetota bacterium]